MTDIQLLTDSKIKHTLIADEFRRQIVANVLHPGSQLPTRTEIIEKYQVSSVTVQKVRQGLAPIARAAS